VDAAPDPARRDSGGEAKDAAIRTGSKSFALAARLFDPTTRDLVWDLYTWCRHCDDVVDGQVLGHGHTALTDLDARLAALDAGTAQAFVGTAGDRGPFAATTGLPRVFADDHLAGFAMDTSGRRYESLDDTLDYAYHVAGVVGLMMAWVMGVRERAVLCRASDLGLAFQLSNIARDVGDDVAAGRLYLPARWLREAGATLTEGFPLDRTSAIAVTPVVARLLTEAERYYDSAWHGVAHLPGRSASVSRAVATARLVYRDIGRAVAYRGAEAWTSRTTVGTAQKLARLAQAGVATAWMKTLGDRTAPPREGLFTPSTISMVG
jgi:15-cis-phytoene synthase